MKMHEHNDLYRRYKTDRKREHGSLPGAPDNGLDSVGDADEISVLYRQYRQQRDPDFEESIEMVMQVAREKIETENAVKDIVAAAVLPAGEEVVEKAGSRSGLLRTVLTAPGRAFDSVMSAMTGGERKWAPVAVPVVAAAVIAIGVLAYLGPDRGVSQRQAGSFDLAFLDPGDQSRAETVAEFVGGSATTSLGFTGVFRDDVKAFYLGVHSVDLQVAVAARQQTLVESVTTRLQGLLAEGEAAETTAQLNKLTTSPDSTVDTISVLRGLQESQGSFKPWYDWGRDVQSVHYSSQFALDKGLTEPLIVSIKGFADQYKKLDESGLSDPEIKIAREIVSLAGESNFTPAQLRNVRDGAKDIIALRRQSAP